MIDKKILNFLVIIVLTIVTFWWTSFIFHLNMAWDVVGVIITLRVLSSLFILKDYSLSWSKATQKTFLLKSIIVSVPLFIYVPIFHGDVRIAFMLSEAMTYLVTMSFIMYTYYYYINKSYIVKTKSLVIYGAGKTGMKLEDEFRNSEYKMKS